MKKSFCPVIIVVLITAFSCNSQNIDSPEKSGNPLIGTWKLVAYSDFDTVTQKWVYPYGEHPKGYFTYTKTGIVNLNGSAEKPLVVPVDSEYTMPLTLGAVLDNAFGYFGTYSIDSSNSVVTHHVKGGSVINYIGTDQHRQFIIRGDSLFLGDPTFEVGRRVLIREE